MPGGDRTGPEGEGPMTGRARGYCAGNESPGYFRGGGRGAGGGQGRGNRHMFHATGLPRWMRGAGRRRDLEALRQEAAALEQRLESVNRRIRELDEDSGRDDG